MTMLLFGLNAEEWYLVCFAVGLVLTLLSAVSGLGHLSFGHLHLPHLHLGKLHIVGHHDPAQAHGNNGLSAFNGFTLMAFLCWFGGTGYLLRHHTALAGVAVLVFSLLSGFAGSALVFGFLTRVLLSRERVFTEEETAMPGVLARVTSSIREGGIGEIAFSQGGARRAAAARSETGAAIARDAEVVVLRYERGVAYVEPWSEMDMPPPA